MSFFRRLVWSFASIVMISSSLNAQSPLLEINFNGSLGNQLASNSTFNALVVSPSAITRGTGIAPHAFADSISSTGWTNSTSIDANDYYTFTFNSTSISTLSSLFINANRNGLGPRLIEVRDSVSGFGTAGVAQSLPNASLITPINFNLSGVSALQSIPANTLVELRIYAYDSQNATNSQFALDSSGNFPAVTLNGAVPGTPVPEPATIGGLAAVGLIGIGWIRRRLKKS